MRRENLDRPEEVYGRVLRSLKPSRRAPQQDALPAGAKLQAHRLAAQLPAAAAAVCWRSIEALLSTFPTVSPSRRIRFTESKLRGCFVLQFPFFQDHRGTFLKTMQASAFADAGLDSDFQEVFYTESLHGVIRGMHFQVPPADHAKLVYCVTGAICDIALDLRIGSPTYGQHEVYELSADASNGVYLPRGIAHGFQVRSLSAGIFYHVTTEHVPAYDTGILWNSFGAPWPISDPIVSARDASHVAFADFSSPFHYTPQD